MPDYIADDHRRPGDRMKTYKFSEARQNLAAVLEEAASTGEVRISRRDGRSFVIRPAKTKRSPLDVPGIGASPDEEVLRAMAEHPILIERPIVVRGGRAVVGRPPESVRDLL
ncbi:MAG TPA: type II toxin-antitoxin system prevent-host-death family antitoxin [Thermoanaerobaculia bacterium]